MIDEKLVTYLESYLTKHRVMRFNEVLKNRTKHFTVATEDVYQLHNTSAVMRTCDVFGIQELHVIEELNVKRIDREIAMGAQKWVDLMRHNSTKQAIESIKKQGYQIVATTPHIHECSLNSFDISKKSCFFFGRETEGLSDEVLEHADQFLTIPMVGFTESLNISVAAAIILENLTNKLRNSNYPWRLSEKEQEIIYANWLEKSIKNVDEIKNRFFKTP
jgi:tRNA (guanosine-2'-O-)-methyltransferase